MPSDLQRQPGVGAGELRFLVAALQAVAVTAVVAVPLCWLLAGDAGAAGAGVAAGLLLVLFGVPALLHHVAAPFGREVWMAVTVSGFVFRLGLYFLVVRALEGVGGIHGLSLGLTAAGGVLVGQVLEMRALAQVRPATGFPATRHHEGVDR